MSFFPTGTTALMSSLAESARATAYAVLRTVQTPDGEGGWTDVETAVSTGVCRFSDRLTSTTEQVAADRLNIQRPAVAWLPQTADVTEGDRIRIGSQTFDIMAALPGGTYAVQRHLVLSERL